MLKIIPTYKHKSIYKSKKEGNWYFFYMISLHAEEIYIKNIIHERDSYSCGRNLYKNIILSCESIISTRINKKNIPSFKWPLQSYHFHLLSPYTWLKQDASTKLVLPSSSKIKVLPKFLRIYSYLNIKKAFYSSLILNILRYYIY